MTVQSPLLSTGFSVQNYGTPILFSSWYRLYGKKLEKCDAKGACCVDPAKYAVWKASHTKDGTGGHCRGYVWVQSLMNDGRIWRASNAAPGYTDALTNYRTGAPGTLAPAVRDLVDQGQIAQDSATSQAAPILVNTTKFSDVAAALPTLPRRDLWLAFWPKQGGHIVLITDWEHVDKDTIRLWGVDSNRPALPNAVGWADAMKPYTVTRVGDDDLALDTLTWSAAKGVQIRDPATQPGPGQLELPWYLAGGPAGTASGTSSTAGATLVDGAGRPLRGATAQPILGGLGDAGVHLSAPAKGPVGIALPPGAAPDSSATITVGPTTAVVHGATSRARIAPGGEVTITPGAASRGALVASGTSTRRAVQIDAPPGPTCASGSRRRASRSPPPSAPPPSAPTSPAGAPPTRCR